MATVAVIPTDSNFCAPHTKENAAFIAAARSLLTPARIDALMEMHAALDYISKQNNGDGRLSNCYQRARSALSKLNLET